MAGVQVSLPSPKVEGASFLPMLCKIKDKLMGQIGSLGGGYTSYLSASPPEVPHTRYPECDPT